MNLANSLSRSGFLSFLLALGVLFSGTASADDHPDPGLPDVCSPPVMAKLDGDWRKEPASFRAAAMRTYTRFLGGEDAAKQQFRATMQLAEQTRVNAFEVIELTKELLIRGFRGKAMESARAATLDIQANQGAAAAGRFTKILGAIQGRGTFTESDLRDLTGLLNGDLLRDALCRSLNLRGSEAALRDQVAPRLKVKPLDAATGVGAVIDALTRQFHATQPGDYARAALQNCIIAMSRACPRKEAEAHCQGTPKDYLELLRL